MSTDHIEKAKRNFEGIEAVHAGKRCALDWAPWMGDWFHSSSPRNDNSHAEGPWDHWVDLAIGILADPLTAKVHPEAHIAVAALATRNFYDEANVELTDADLVERFKDATA